MVKSKIPTNTGVLGVVKTLGYPPNSLTNTSSVYMTPKRDLKTGIESFSVSMNAWENQPHISVEMVTSQIPQNVEELALIIADDYLKSQGIELTLIEIITNFLPEYKL